MHRDYEVYEMSDYDEIEESFRPTQEWWECEGCGEELSQGNPPEQCDCGKSGCLECRHTCAWCSHEGCGSCMTDGVDGWTCGVECEQALAKHAQEQDLLADEHVLEIVVGKMIDCVISHDEERRGAA